MINKKYNCKKSLCRLLPGLFNHAGMGLIEVLISMAITSVAFLGITSLVISTTMGNQNSRLRTVATVLAQDGLDKVVNTGFGITASTTTQGYNTITLNGVSYPNYKRVTSITEVVTNTTTTPQEKNIKKVVVTVFWDNDAQSVQASTQLAK